MPQPPFFTFFFFNDTATTEIYTLSLHDALPIWGEERAFSELVTRYQTRLLNFVYRTIGDRERAEDLVQRSEEHTSELQSRLHLVCRLLLEKKNTADGSSPARSRHGVFRAGREGD